MTTINSDIDQQLAPQTSPSQGISPQSSAPRVNYEQLIQPTRVHSSLYTSPEVFADELEQIWYKTWVFVGHTSEIPEANDYARKKLGPQDVIMTRDKDGEVNLLLNRCSHRGNLVCDDSQGNSSSFRCPYHGWTFSNKGAMLGYPYKQGYGGKNKLNLGLGKVPRVGVYRGFVFGSFAEEGPTLLEHLGGAAGELDRLARISPEGEVELTAGWLKHDTQANWKLLNENETDGYHPQFVHGSIFSVTGSPIGALYSEQSTAVSRAFGNGHAENDLKPEFRKFDEPMRWFGTTEDRLPGYVSRMNEAYGNETAREIMVDGSPHMMIFPNLFIAEIQLFNIQPTSENHCVQYSTAIQFKGAPDLNKRMVSQALASIGPSGMLLADDTEMYERNQAGLNQRDPEWVDISRGKHRETHDEDGYTISNNTDETPNRAFWSNYLEIMTAETEEGA